MLALGTIIVLWPISILLVSMMSQIWGSSFIENWIYYLSFFLYSGLVVLTFYCWMFWKKNYFLWCMLLLWTMFMYFASAEDFKAYFSYFRDWD